MPPKPKLRNKSEKSKNSAEKNGQSILFSQGLAAILQGHTISEENDIYNDCYKGKTTNRINNSNKANQPNYFKYKEGYLFEEGFNFSGDLNDWDQLPEKFSNEFDLFKQYYENLLKSGLLDSFVSDIKLFFSEDAGDVGCQLAGEDLIIPIMDSPIINNKFDGNYKSQAIALTSTFVYGKESARKRVLAETDIDEGDVLFMEKLMFLCKLPKCLCSSNNFYECAYCAKPCQQFYVCETCDIFIYCSQYCKMRSFYEYHFWECKALRYHFFPKTDTTLVAFRMMLTGAHHKFNAEGANVYRDISQIPYDLNADTVTLTIILRKSVATLVYLIDQTDFFAWLTKNGIFKNTTLYEKYLKIGSLLVKHLVQCLNAAVYTPDEYYSLVNPTQGMIFRTPAMSMSLMHFAHSCTPNATYIFTGNVCRLKAISNIKQGEEITISKTHLDGLFYNESQTNYPCYCTDCSSLRIRYSGRLFKCFKCQGNMGRYEDTWKCFECNFQGTNEEFSEKVLRVIKLLKIIADEEYEDQVMMSTFILEYRSIYNVIYSDFLLVLEKLTMKCIENGLVHKGAKLGFQFIEEVERCLHRYSFQKLHILSNVVNAIFKFSKNRGALDERLHRLLTRLLGPVRFLCQFYGLTQQEYELLQAVGNATRVILKGQVDKNDEKEEKEVTNFLAYASLLEKYQCIRTAGAQFTEQSENEAEETDTVETVVEDKLKYVPKCKND